MDDPMVVDGVDATPTAPATLQGPKSRTQNLSALPSTLQFILHHEQLTHRSASGDPVGPQPVVTPRRSRASMACPRCTSPHGVKRGRMWLASWAGKVQDLENEEFHVHFKCFSLSRVVSRTLLFLGPHVEPQQQDLSDDVHGGSALGHGGGSVDMPKQCPSTIVEQATSAPVPWQGCAGAMRGRLRRQSANRYTM